MIESQCDVLISLANIGPKRFHQNRIVSRQISMSFEQQIFHLAQRQGIAEIHHHREADHLRRVVEITEGIARCRRLRILARRLKPV